MTDSFIRLPPDSTGKRTFTIEHDVDGTPIHIPLNHIADANNDEHRLKIDENGAASMTFSEGQPILGGFGALKTTHMRSLGVYEGSLDSYNSLFSIETENGGNAQYVPEESSNILSVNNQDGSRVTKTSNRYHTYLPGTANVAMFSINVGGPSKTNNVRRWGLFDDLDGIYFELNSSGLSCVIRSSVSGSVVVDSQNYNSWNGKLTISEIENINLENSQIFWIDYQWLGTGRVRFGIFSSNGSRVVLHTFRNAGTNILPYMRTGSLPVRIENLNTGSTASSTEIREICSAVYCEGNYQDYTFWRFQSDIIEKTVSTLTPIISIRSKNLINNKPNSAQAYPENLCSFSDNPIAIHLYFTEDLSDALTWAQSSTDCSLEFNMDDSFLPPASDKFRTIFSNGTENHHLSKFFEVNDEGITRNNVNQVLVIAIEPLTNSATTTQISLGIKELW